MFWIIISGSLCHDPVSSSRSCPDWSFRKIQRNLLSSARPPEPQRLRLWCVHCPYTVWTHSRLGDLVVELTRILLKPPLCLLAEGITWGGNRKEGGEWGGYADLCLWPPLTVVAVVQPDAMAVVLAVAFHGVVGEVALCHLVVGVDHDLQGWEAGS